MCFQMHIRPLFYMSAVFWKHVTLLTTRFPIGSLCCRSFSKHHELLSRNIMANHENNVVEFPDQKFENEKTVIPSSSTQFDTGEKEDLQNTGNADKIDKTENTETVQSKTKDALNNPMGLSKRALKRMLKNEINKAKKKAARSQSLTKNSNPGFSTDYFGLTEYYYENGLRKVYPYYFKFESHVKKRWVGQSLFKVLKEFQNDQEGKFKTMEEVLKDGDITLNGKVVTIDKILKDNDFISHRIHRHENPVIGTPLEIVVDNDDVIVINKPSSIPVHPCGRYRYNSIPFILGKDLGYTNLRTIYRLDRLTSGLLIMAKSAEKTREMEDDILQRRVRKEYLARVEGRFPDGIIECDQPLGVLSSKDSLYGVVPGGKESKTVFEFISYNGSSSLIRCLPQTGRTHQIRLHLQYLGFPIKNDPMYNKGCFGPNNAKDGILEKPLEEIVKSFRENHNTGLWVEGDNPLFHKRLQEMKTQTDQNDVKSSGEEDSPNFHIATSESYTSPGESCKLDQSENSSRGQFESKAADTNKCEEGAANLSLLSQTCFTGEEPSAKRCKLAENASCNDTGTSSSGHCGQISSVIKHEKSKFDPQKWKPEEKCFYCRKRFRDPEAADMIMYLHALKYKVFTLIVFSHFKIMPAGSGINLA
ncbi:pseudouridylate synthase RPUSD2-like [Argopecten irradians]|uniref:pseudouridylate synthase RPUSD2-like n=1 Tax=Argopecten irradians TaxID=31199 RepID=UPI00371321DE